MRHVNPVENTGGIFGGGGCIREVAVKLGGGGRWGVDFECGGGLGWSERMMDNNANPEFLKEHLLGIRCLKLSFLVNQTPPLGAHLSLDQSAAFSCYLKHTHTQNRILVSVSVRSPEMKVWWIPQDRKRYSHLRETWPFCTKKKNHDVSFISYSHWFGMRTCHLSYCLFNKRML